MQLFLEAVLLTGLMAAIATSSHLMRQTAAGLNLLPVPVSVVVRPQA